MWTGNREALKASRKGLHLPPALWKLARMYSLGLLTEEEFGAFSEENRETVVGLLSLGRR